MIVYIPLLDYWAYWKTPFLWPSDFYYNDGSGSLLYPSDDEKLGYYPTAQAIFNILSTVTGFLSVFSTILFITFINKKRKNKFYFLNWIPLINSFSIGIQIVKILKPKLPQILLIKFWVFLSFMFIYYRFFAGWLYFLGLDSVSFIGDVFYPATEETEAAENYGYGYIYISDLLTLINPPLFYISGLLSFLVFKLIYKKHIKSFDFQISEIGKDYHSNIK
ncbi:hypothetical protein FUA24_05645 [Seonamhaeicola marinus]|uniref:Uncharacterized protein n=1 Tax=Seonamhaeicola marinus TaxID=1912246 RepID=A0A5D0IKQ3_9FLAO|nr:hypothetical protein FUA24_05645 [Seonamhaeicola marinus]